MSQKKTHANAAYVPLQKICKREHENRSHKMPIGYIHIRVHPMVEGSFSDEIQEAIAHLD